MSDWNLRIKALPWPIADAKKYRGNGFERMIQPPCTYPIRPMLLANAIRPKLDHLKIPVLSQCRIAQEPAKDATWDGRPEGCLIHDHDNIWIWIWIWI